LLEEV